MGKFQWPKGFFNFTFHTFFMSNCFFKNLTLFYHVCWALIHLAGKLSIRHVELRKRMTWRQRHLREICRWQKLHLYTHLKSTKKRSLLVLKEMERACAIPYRPGSKRKWSFSDRWDFSWWFRWHCSTDQPPFRCNPRGSQYIPRRNVSIGIHKQGRDHLLIQVNFIDQKHPDPINQSITRTLHAH